MRRVVSSTSESADQVPTSDELAIVQSAIQALEAQCELNPLKTLADLEPILDASRKWTRCDAYLWLLLIRARALRYSSQLDDAVATAEAGLIDNGPELVTAHLELEAGMALNEMGEPWRAQTHLEKAVSRYASVGDDDGEAWALTALAVASTFTQTFDPKDLLDKAMQKSEEDTPIRAMIWHRQSVLHRHRGDIAEALVAIEAALASTGRVHSRANYLLERGHQRAWVGGFSDADEDYVAALETYLDHSDLLGAGNAEHALAINALRLGRHADGLSRLNEAADHLRQVTNRGALANVLRERALLLAPKGMPDAALRDLEEARRELEDNDPLGLASVHRAFARVHATKGDLTKARAAIARAEEVTNDERDPLGVASNLLLAAEMAASPTERTHSARRSADLYRDLVIPQGEAHALAFLVEAHADLGDAPATIEAMQDAADALHRARITVADPGRRADHDYELHPVTRSFTHAASVLNDANITMLLADHLVELSPLGLRAAFAHGHIDGRVRALIERLAGTQARGDRNPTAHRPGLQELAAVLATLATEGDVPRPTFKTVTDRRPDAAHLFVGPPTSRAQLPMAWCLPDGPPRFTSVDLTDELIEIIDSLGRSFAPGETDLLWAPSMTGWTTELARVLLPDELGTWLGAQEARRFVVHLPPVLGHIPIEALDLDGQPLGARAAVSRLCSTTATPAAPSDITSSHAFLDPSLPWAPERLVLGDAVESDQELRDGLGPGRLIHIGCHGTPAPRTEGCLQTTDGRCVTDALDLLGADLSGSVVVLEACFSGRHLGHRLGETLNLSTIAMLAGSAWAVGAIFALPADDECTGAIVAGLLRHLDDGVPTDEALRRARSDYLMSAPDQLTVPGGGDDTMSGVVPWAWAGLVALSR